jgi:hypothetical protein
MSPFGPSKPIITLKFNKAIGTTNNLQLFHIEVYTAFMVSGFPPMRE